MHQRGQWIVQIGLGMLALAASTGCATTEEQAEASATAGIAPTRVISLDDRVSQPGGDQHAWLTGAGNLADTNYCSAEIILPLATEPAWDFTYTPAQFSRSAVNSVIHYDGLLVAGAHCSQLLGLDVDTGQQVFNRDVYYRDGLEDQIEDLSRLFCHPQGLLLGLDFQGRIYCWDMLGQELDQLWLVKAGDDTRTTIASGNDVFSGWGTTMKCLSVVDGSQGWEYPNLSGSNGLVMSADGLVVSWTAKGEFYCMDSADGRLIWTILMGTSAGLEWPTRAVIDDVHSRIYMLLPDERVQCRDLHSSNLLWEHRWSDLVPADVRRRQFAEFNAEAVPLWSSDIVLHPEGLVISMLHGQTISLDLAGNRKWVYDSEVLILGELGFSNAILIIEWYLGGDFRGISPAWRSFSAVPPDWARIQAADEHRQLYGSFQRFCLLDYLSGKVISTLEPEYPVNVILPAHSKIVLGESDRLATSAGRILAYDWLSWEGE